MALDAVLLRWQRWTLARRFAVCAAAVVLPVVALTGVWVSSVVESKVTRNAAAAATLYVESVVAPLVQELGTSDHISPANTARLQRLLDETSLGKQAHPFVIWHRDGRVAFSSRRDLVGKSFPVSERLRDAWQGTASAEYKSPSDLDHAAEHSAGTALTEVYVPVRGSGSERIIAVAEIYQNSRTLQQEIADAHRQTWLRVGGISAVMLMALFLIVRQGSRTIETQRRTLRARVAESNELYLKRLGGDLHDGPTQLLSLALLTLDDTGAAPRKGAANRKGPTTGEIVAQAMRELRQIAAGLTIPDIATMSVEAAIRAAVRRHEELSGTRVDLDLAALPGDAPQALKICIYRFVQEGLTNALKHAGGAGQRVSARGAGDFIRVEVVDSGKGSSPGTGEPPGERSGLGIRAMRDRVESLRGELEVSGGPGIGMRIAMRLPLLNGDERLGR